MRFQALDIIPHQRNPLTGNMVSTAERIEQVIEAAGRAEELGYDLAENYAMLRRLWEEDITWSGRFRSPLTEPATIRGIGTSAPAPGTCQDVPPTPRPATPSRALTPAHPPASITGRSPCPPDGGHHDHP